MGGGAEGGADEQKRTYGSYLPFTGAGHVSAEYWANRVVDAGGFWGDPVAGIGLGLSSLWADQTATETALTLASGGTAGAIAKVAGQTTKFTFSSVLKSLGNKLVPKSGASLGKTIRNSAIGGAVLSGVSNVFANRDVKVGKVAGAVVTGAVSGALFGSAKFLAGGAGAAITGAGELVGAAAWQVNSIALGFGTSKMWLD